MQPNRLTRFWLTFIGWCLIAMAVAGTAALETGCTAKRLPSADGSKQAPVTPWEQVFVTNAQIASLNQTVARGVIDVQQAGLLEKAVTKDVLMQCARLARAQKKLTPVLVEIQVLQAKGLATGDAHARFEQLEREIAEASGAIAGLGGVKDVGKQQQINAWTVGLTDLVLELGRNLIAAGVK